MGHSICGLVIAQPFDTARANAYDLIARVSVDGVVVFPIDHYWSAYWQARLAIDGLLDLPDGVPIVFPSEAVVCEVVGEITRVATQRFAVIMTEYFGGVGEQWAVVFEGRSRIGELRTINSALAELGLACQDTRDQFDTLGLGDFRHNPRYLDRYRDLCNEIGA